MNPGLLFLLVFSIFLAVFGALMSTFYMFKSSNTKRTTMKRELEKANYLFQCKNEKCKKFFRQYQMNLYKEKHSEYRCPHCEMRLKAINAYKAHQYSDNYFKVENIDPWMDTHPDCMLIGKKEFKNILKSIELLKKLKEDEAIQKRYEEYNKLKVDFSWIENLNKEEKIKDL